MKPGRSTILLLAGIAALGSLATQLLIPALPVIAREMHAGFADAQLIVGFYLVCLGGGQLVAGPLADRIGRKPVLLGGLALYCLGSAAAALSPALPVLLAARAVQGLGASAGIVTARVLINDIYGPEEAASRQATLMAVVLISPALAPVIGGALTEWLGWRTVFGGMAGAGMIAAMLAVRRLPSQGIGQRSLSGNSLLADYRSLIRNRRFLTSALAIAGGSSALYMFLGAAPFLLMHDHGLSPREIGACLMMVAAASIAGTFAVGPIERRGNALVAGTATSACGAATLVVLAIMGEPGLWAFEGAMIVLGLGAGMTGPAGIARVIAAAPRLAGTAASSAGAFQMLVSALAAYLLAHVAKIAALPLGIGLALATGTALLAAIVASQPVMQELAQSVDCDIV